MLFLGSVVILCWRVFTVQEYDSYIGRHKSEKRSLYWESLAQCGVTACGF